MRHLWILALIGCANPDAGEPWGTLPGPEDRLPPPPGVDLEGPTQVTIGSTQTWTVSGTALADGDRVDFGYGLSPGPGRCLNYANGVCLDITSARRLAQGTVQGGVARFTLPVPGTTLPQIHLQAVLVDGPSSERSDVLTVDLDRCRMRFDQQLLGNVPYGSPAVAIDDFNADGHVDIWAVGGGLFIADGAGGFNEEAATRGVVHERGAYGIYAADFDADGDVDVLIPNDYTTSAGPTRLWLNDGAGQFTDVAALWGLTATSLINSNSNAIAWVDLDGDSDLDLFFAGFTGNASTGPTTASVFRNDGAPPFVDIADSFTTSLAGDSMAWFDVDEDGEIEGFETTGNNFTPNRVWDFDGAEWNDIGGTVGLSGSSSQQGRWGNPTVLDLDGDGDLDVHAPMSANPDFVFINDGSGQYTQAFAADYGLPEVTSFGTGALWQDVDLDGDLDAFFKLEGLYENLGDGQFALAALQPNLPSSQGNGTWGDIDGDGLADLVLGGSQPQIQYTTQTGCDLRSFTFEGTHNGSPLRAGTVMVDLDGNGDFSPAGGLTTFALGAIGGDTATPGSPIVLGMGTAPTVDMRVVVNGTAYDILGIEQDDAARLDLP